MAKLRFGAFVLDMDNRLLLRQGAPVPLEPKVYDCIALLAQRAGQLTLTEQLRKRLWPDVNVGPGALRRIINEARRALGDRGDAQVVIRTRKGVGYEFALPVEHVIDSSVARVPLQWPFVGRQSELATLRAAVAGLARGRGALALVIGPAGIGKSSLISELVQGASTDRWLRAHCPSDASAPPFWAWRRLAGELLEQDEIAAELRAFARREPVLARLVPELAGEAPGSSLALADSEQRFLVCDAYLRALLRVASSLPLPIVLEDVHLADDATLLLLSMLANVAAQHPLFVCATLRPEALAGRDALAQFVAGARGREGVITCELGELSLPELDTLLSAVNYRPTQRSAEALRELTGGNPLYVRELVTRALTTGDADTGELATSLFHVVQNRARALPGATGQLLGIAAVLGQRFTGALLAQVTERAAAAVLEDLEPALASRILTWSGEGQSALAFAHALLRDALYAALPLRTRQRYHAEAAHVWERAPQGIERTSALAAHAYAAGEALEKQERMSYCERAGREAFTTFAFDQAALHLGRALELCADAPPSESKAELALMYARARWHADDPAEAVTEAFSEAARQAERCGAVRLFAEAAIGCAVGDEAIGGVRAVLWKPDCFELLKAALKALESRDNDAEHALLRHRVARSLCWLYTSSGRGAEAAEYTRLALTYAPPHTDAWTTVLVNGLRCADALWSADPARARAELRAICDDAERPELSLRQGIDAGIQALVMCLALGELERYARVLSRIEAASAELPEPVHFGRIGERFRAYRTLPCVARVTLAIIEGDFGAADRRLLALRQNSAKAGRTVDREGTLILLLLQLFGYRGQAGSVEPLLERYSARYPDEFWFIALCRAQIAIERGDLAAARAHYAVLGKTDFQLPLRGRHVEPRLEARVRLADVCAALGAAQDARSIYDSLARGVELCASHGPLISLGSNARALGELSLIMAEPEHALEHFQTALRVNTRFGHRPELVRARLGLAKSQLRLGRFDAARAEIATASAEAAQIGMLPMLALCDELSQSAPL
ncbi:MAG TPA: AAA family ATPase [Polyangiaceae bacterium]